MSVEAAGFDARLVTRGRSGGWGLPAVSGPFLLTALLFLVLNVQMLTFSGHLAEGESGPALKLYHGLFGCVGLLLLWRGRLVRWRPEMIVYFVVIGITAVLAGLRFGPQPLIMNTIFAAYAATVGSTLGLMSGHETALRALRWTSVLVLAAVLVKAVLFLPEILRFLAAPDGHPLLPTFYGGGPNIEATWVAMGGLFLIGSRLFVPYILGSGVLSVAYASRVGMITVAFVVLAGIVGTMLRDGNGGARWRRWLLPVALIVLTAVGVGAARGVTGADYIAQRFQRIGEDPGSTSRLTLWIGGADVFTAHPFGVGLGNAVPQIERAIAANIKEDNLHNLYLQHLVDTGVQGLVVFLLLAGLAWHRVLVSRFQNPMVLYVGIYFVLALLQFRGAEALLWFVYGLQRGAATLPEEMNAA